MIRRFLLALVRLWPSRPDVRAVVYPETEYTRRVDKALADFRRRGFRLVGADRGKGARA